MASWHWFRGDELYIKEKKKNDTSGENRRWYLLIVAWNGVKGIAGLLRTILRVDRSFTILAVIFWKRGKMHA